MSHLIEKGREKRLLADYTSNIHVFTIYASLCIILTQLHFASHKCHQPTGQGPVLFMLNFHLCFMNTQVLFFTRLYRAKH